MRLIDADALLKEIKEYEDGCKMLLLDVDPRVIKQHIIFAPTVDQWHYPSKGDYPTEEQQKQICLCFGYDRLKNEDVYWLTRPCNVYKVFDLIAWMPLSEPPKEMK